jgi:hypothetical protein
VDHAGPSEPLRLSVIVSALLAVKSYKLEFRLRILIPAVDLPADKDAMEDIPQVPGTTLRIQESLLDGFGILPAGANHTHYPLVITTQLANMSPAEHPNLPLLARRIANPPILELMLLINGTYKAPTVSHPKYPKSKLKL